jgi:hypothetical protein
MKVAICLSGQPRAFELGYNYLLKNLLSVNKEIEFHFFIHTWNCKIAKEYIDFFLPKSFILEDKILSKGDSSLRYTFRDTVAEAFSAMQADLLRTRYELIFDFKYDFVIKTRTDFALSVPIDVSDLDLTSIYFTDIGLELGVFHPSLIIGSSEKMNTITHYFDSLHACPKNWGTERILYEHVSRSGLLASVIIFKHPTPFPPGPYNSTSHALIRDDMKYWLEESATMG